MLTQNPRLAVIVGSVREGRFGPAVARWFADTAAVTGRFDIDVIDLPDHPRPGPSGPCPDPDPEADRALAAVSGRLAAADAFVVVTPEYHPSYPASLKRALARHGTQWQAKPVGFVCYGGFSGGRRAVEHLRQVFAELHTFTVRDTVRFPCGAFALDPNGTPGDSAGPRAAVKSLVDQLAWWATALSGVRAKVACQP